MGHDVADLERPRTKKSVALSGVIAGDTAISSVSPIGDVLRYRGYDVQDLAEECSFEEVAHLLVHGSLPTSGELSGYSAKLRALRGLPSAVRRTLEALPAAAHPMDVLRTGISAMGCVFPESSDCNLAGTREIADRLIAASASILLYWHHYSANGRRIEVETDDDTVGGHVLHLLHGKAPRPTQVFAMQTSLVLYGEHEFNASTFTGRVITATLSDMHSAIAGAIGALRGPLHGGANEAAMELIERFDSAEAATKGVHEMLAKKELIMGFGHRVYTTSDPRNSVNKRMSKQLADLVGDTVLYPVSEAIEKVMWDEKKLFANADFYAATVYHFLGIPTKLFTPIFVCSRVTGWAAHVMEQRAHNKLIRPAADYTGPGLQDWLPIDQR